MYFVKVLRDIQNNTIFVSSSFLYVFVCVCVCICIVHYDCFAYIYWHTCKIECCLQHCLSPSNSTHFLQHFVEIHKLTYHYQILISEVIILITFHMLFGCSATCSRFSEHFFVHLHGLLTVERDGTTTSMTKKNASKVNK